jgi:hypothetical protein
LLALLSDAALAELLEAACCVASERRRQTDAAISWLRVVLAETERRGGSV